MPQIFLVVRQDLAGLRKLVNRVCFPEARFFFESFYLLADKIGVPDEETRLIENSLVTGQNRPFNRIKLWQSTLQCLQSMM